MIDDKTYSDLMEDGALHLYDKSGEKFIGTIRLDMEYGRFDIDLNDIFLEVKDVCGDICIPFEDAELFFSKILDICQKMKEPKKLTENQKCYYVTPSGNIQKIFFQPNSENHLALLSMGNLFVHRFFAERAKPKILKKYGEIRRENVE